MAFLRWKDFLYTFIPILVAMDAVGLVPMYLSLTRGLSDEERKKVSVQALLTALVISVIFLGAGKLIFKAIGISLADFTIAGGVLLLVLSVIEMLNLSHAEKTSTPNVGMVPLGTPLIAGPAVLTSLLILSSYRGYAMTFLSLLVNLLIVAISFQQSRRLAQWIGEQGMRAFSQVISLFLAAIAISLIRRGLTAG